METIISIGLWVLCVLAVVGSGYRLAGKRYGDAICTFAEGSIVFGAISLINGWV